MFFVDGNSVLFAGWEMKMFVNVEWHCDEEKIRKRFKGNIMKWQGVEKVSACFFAFHSKVCVVGYDKVAKVKVRWIRQLINEVGAIGLSK